MELEYLNALDSDAATRELLRCCGSRRWAEAMTAARPFGSVEAIRVTADVVWGWLSPSDWLEAFAAHPRIGAGRAGGTWSAQEQAGARSAASHVLDRLAALNRQYEQRFGYIFIVCATGKTGDEMLGLLEQRLHNRPDEELRIAAGEQAKITRLRLRKLLDGNL
jgi:2-oxo-4-hydroxy-4-carboxy-5-ureidoimidazoline decarboxylase